MEPREMGVVVCVCVWKRVCVDVRWGGHGDENYLVADTLVLGCISVSLGSLCFLYISSFLLILHSLSSLFFRFLSIPLSLSVIHPFLLLLSSADCTPPTQPVQYLFIFIFAMRNQYRRSAIPHLCFLTQMRALRLRISIHPSLAVTARACHTLPSQGSQMKE